MIILRARGRRVPFLRFLIRDVRADGSSPALNDLESYERKGAEADERRQELRLAFGPVCPQSCSVSK